MAKNLSNLASQAHMCAYKSLETMTPALPRASGVRDHGLQHRRHDSQRLGMAILQHAGDTIICLKHDVEGARNMKMLLNIFEMLSGLKVNFNSLIGFCKR